MPKNLIKSDVDLQAIYDKTLLDILVDLTKLKATVQLEIQCKIPVDYNAAQEMDNVELMVKDALHIANKLIRG